MVIDVITILIGTLGFYWGFKKGLTHTVLTFASFFVAIMAGTKLCALGVDWLAQNAEISKDFLPIIAFVGIFLLTLICLRIIVWIVGKMLSITGLSIFDKLAGGILFASLGLFVSSLLIWFLGQTFFIAPATKESSVAFPILSDLAPFLFNCVGEIIPWFKDLFHQFELLFDKEVVQPIYESA